MSEKSLNTITEEEIKKLQTSLKELKQWSDLREQVTSDIHRGLHWVVKIGNLQKSLEFLEKVLYMKVLRHEENNVGCDAQCNGPYQRPWSKTMVGYGLELDNFCLELTYNYGIAGYRRGNDLRYIGLYALKTSVKVAKELGYEVHSLSSTSVKSHEEEKDKKSDSDNNNNTTTTTTTKNTITKIQHRANKPLIFDYCIIGPDQVPYYVSLVDQLPIEPFISIGLNVQNVDQTYKYWINTLNMHEMGYIKNEYVRASFSGQIVLEFYQLSKNETLDFGKAAGRIAFTTRIKSEIWNEYLVQRKYTIHTKSITLPGGETVIIVQDPNGYEICLVDELGFDKLCFPKEGNNIINWNTRKEMGADQGKGKIEQ